jgi:hypothetical protein
VKIDDGERKCADDRSCLRTDNGPAPAMKPPLCAHRMRFSLRMRNRLRLAAAEDVTAVDGWRCACCGSGGGCRQGAVGARLRGSCA